MEGREQNLQAGATIGREGCDVNLMDPEVSRRHAAIRDAGGSLAIEDLGSTNGTFVNDTRISAVTVLRDGDTVRLGNTVWAIKSTAPAGATSVGAAPPAAAAPQVTAARAVPTDIQTPAPQATTAQAVPPAPAAPAAAPAAAAASAAPQSPAQPAAPSAAPVGRRGDVDAPPEVVPSAIRRVVLPPTPGKAPVFQNPGSRPGGSAATRLDATIVCLIIVAATAAALVVYFITV